MADIPGPAKERLLQLMRLLNDHIVAGNTDPVTSAQAESLTGWPRDTIRKDISFLADGSVGGSAGYEPERLIPLIQTALGLDRRRKCCVVGLGRLGSAYLNFTPPELAEFEIAAGFDTNVNRVEILHTPALPLYPAYKLAEVVGRQGIEIALLCVPSASAQSAATQCASAGIRGILNFAPVALRLPPEIAVRNVYVTDELRSLAIKMTKE